MLAACIVLALLQALFGAGILYHGLLLDLRTACSAVRTVCALKVP